MSVCKLETQTYWDSKDFGSVFCESWKKWGSKVSSHFESHGNSTSEGGRWIWPVAWQHLARYTSRYTSYAQSRYSKNLVTFGMAHLIYFGDFFPSFSPLKPKRTFDFVIVCIQYLSSIKTVLIQYSIHIVLKSLKTALKSAVEHCLLWIWKYININVFL